MITKQLLEEFDAYLQSNGLEFEGVVVGASALILRGIIDRATIDVDLLEKTIPKSVQEAASSFAANFPELKANWLNCSASVLVDSLPEGWCERLECLYQGQALRLKTLGRDDLLITKLLGYCDRGMDLYDCVSLSPTKQELRHTFLWVKEQDSEKRWPKHVQKCFHELARRLGYEFSENDFPI
jgi:hypothetical protein